MEIGIALDRPPRIRSGGLMSPEELRANSSHLIANICNLTAPYNSKDNGVILSKKKLYQWSSLNYEMSPNDKENVTMKITEDAIREGVRRKITVTQKPDSISVTRVNADGTRVTYIDTKKAFYEAKVVVRHLNSNIDTITRKISS
ncbi:MAG: hypothetical protein U1C56_02290 [Candidatus Curtissbacteria bacterium]|nr:hypothetical protein [Candidatus Levybacteria bacterium]MDZ4209985.1 hypothetical protein [Candidatus Curtissbacteria bacterium]